MKIGAFQLDEPLPDLNKPHALVILRPWINVGSVGSLTLNSLEKLHGAHPLGRLLRPGNFIDFTRYRPFVSIIDGERSIAVPNSYIDFAQHPNGRDFLFFNLLEPHMFGEIYIESILKVLRKFHVERYCLIGSMHDVVPHTKPLIVSGSASGKLAEQLITLGLNPSNYEGPGTIATLISQEAPRYNIDIMSLIVHLPQYAQLDEDHAGQLRLLEVLCSLYDFQIDLEPIRLSAEKQYENLSKEMYKDPQFEKAIGHLEELYEARIDNTGIETPNLPPDIEKFLHEIDNGFQQN
jgi:hypothetical protein